MADQVDRNDVDQYGMDMDTRRRLKVGRMLRVRKKAKKPISTQIPGKYRVPDDLHERERFDTLGSKGRDTEDQVGYVTSMFFHSTPEFERSLVSREAKRNGWVLQGSWPLSGRSVFDWEFDIWGERGKAVVVKFNMWDMDGRNEGQTYRTTVATVRRVVLKFLSKVFVPAKMRAKQKASIWLQRGEDIVFTVDEYNVMIIEMKASIAAQLNEAKSKLTPYQKAQLNRRQTIALHTMNPSKQSTFYKHAVRAIFNKLRKDGEGFKGAAKGGQLIAQWMMKKYGYAVGNHDSTKEDPENIGRVRLTSKGVKRNRKHTSEPAGLRKRKEAAYNHIMGIRKREVAKRQAVTDKARGAG
jgi:hypothetical protein